ncbi:outer membrane protein assembly factor BamD [bacterium]|nr:outer membrane protein assembly factor BamD [bacterium]
MQLILQPNTKESRVLLIKGTAATIGSASENIVCLPGAAPYHVTLFFLEGAWFAEDLSGQGFLLDGRITKRAQLRVGNCLEIGSVRMLLVQDSVSLEKGALAAGDKITAVEAEELSAADSFSARNEVVVSAGNSMSSMPALDAVTLEMEEREERVDTTARLSVIFGACGPLILLCGQLIGFILGIIALAKRGLNNASRRSAWTGLFSSLVWWILIGAVIAAFVWQDMNKNRIARNEASIARLLNNIVTAQIYVRNAILIDVNGDLDGEYATFDQLENISYREATLRELAQQPLRRGYLLTVQRADEDGFELCATPETYGITGNKTFWIDQAGFLYSADTKGEPITKSTMPLDIDRSDHSVYEVMENEISDDIAKAAEDAFKKEDYLKCQKIIENIQTVFPNSKVKERLTVLEKASDPFLIEMRSKKLMDDAEKFCELKQFDAAIERLRQLMANYPSSTLFQPAKQKIIDLTREESQKEMDLAENFKNAHQWNEMNNHLNQLTSKYPEAMDIYQPRINACREQANALREEDAKALKKQAQDAEIAQRYEEAYNIYLKIRNEYGGTSASVGVDESLNKTGAQINEIRAQQQVKEILGTVALGNELAVVQMIDLLERGYSQTKEYEKVKEVVQKLRRECSARLFTTQANELFQNKSYHAALTKIEMAIQEDPAVKVAMSDKLEECYAALGDAAYENQDLSLALSYYQKYLAMRPMHPIIDRKRLMECYFFKAKELYAAKNFAEARTFFERCMEAYGSNPEFNFMYGMILYTAEEWENTLRFFANCQNGPSALATDAKKYWTFSLYNLALSEDEILRKMILENNVIREVMANYDLEFDTKPRTEGQQKVKLLEVAPKNAETYDSVLRAAVDALDALAIQASKHTIISKDRKEQKIDSTYNLNNSIKNLKALLKKMYAYSSSERENNQKINAELKKMVKQYSDLVAALATIKQKNPTPSIIDGHQQLTEKLIQLKAAQENFEKYMGVCDWRQQYALSEFNSLLENTTVASINHNVIRSEADKIREFLTNRKDLEEGVKALRAITSMYKIVPNLTQLGLGDIVPEGEKK